MDQFEKTTHDEAITQASQAAEYPPFENPEAITDYNTVRARELGEVIKAPDVIGLNLDSSSIVNPRILRGAEFVEQSLAEGKTMAEISATLSAQYQRDVTPEQISAAIDAEKEKLATFNREIAALPEGTKFRVHSNGAQSPFVVPECVKTNENGEKQAVFHEVALQQIKTLKDKAGDTDLTVVMNLWTKEHAGNVPKTPEEIEDYFVMCEGFVQQADFGDGKGLILELGNEANVNRNTDDRGFKPFDREEFGDTSSPAEYAEFYYQVASKLKAEFPQLKLSLAGTAFYDREYVQQVVDSVQGRADGLIDVISFHPYRGTVEEGTAEIAGNQKQNSTLSFDEQLAEMRRIADTAGAEVTVGEVSFAKEWGKSINAAEQAKNTQKSRELGVSSYIWPGCQILRYP